MKDPISDIIAWIENSLATYYKFSPLSSANFHLISRHELEEGLGLAIKTRAGVYVSGEGDDLYLGLHINHEISENLKKYDPRQKLTHENLDAFCILVEEVSHFHLILNRIANNKNVSLIELESLGEIDKVLLSYLMLAEQTRSCYLLPLARKIFDTASILVEDERREIYEKASNIAAKFWFRAIDKGLHPFEEVRRYLVHAYNNRDLSTVDAAEIKIAA